jgi:hypothetical protein
MLLVHTPLAHVVRAGQASKPETNAINSSHYRTRFSHLCQHTAQEQGACAFFSRAARELCASVLRKVEL